MIFGTKLASKIHGKSCQVGPSWPKLGSSWANLGSSWAKLACHMQALMYKFTRCGSHALSERNLALHSANMARKPSQNGGLEGGSELRFFGLFSFLRASWRQEGPREGQEGPREFQELMLGGFWVDFEVVLGGLWKNFVVGLGLFFNGS